MDSFEAIADQVRRGILTRLTAGELTAGAVAQEFPHITRPAVSRHLRVLREAGLVRAESRGRERVYRATTEPLGEVVAWIGGLLPLPAISLDALETEVYRTRRERREGSSRRQRAHDGEERSA